MFIYWIFSDVPVLPIIVDPRFRVGRRYAQVKRNPLKNMKVLLKLNPYAKVEKHSAKIMQKAALKKKASAQKVLDLKVTI